MLGSIGRELRVARHDAGMRQVDVGRAIGASGSAVSRVELGRVRSLSVVRLARHAAAVGLKPTIRINHLVIQDRPGQTIIASKMLYASHYFWTALEQRILQSDPARGPGFWLVTINRSRSDGLKGFVGRLLRGRVRSEAQKGTEATLRVTKAKLEAR